MRQFKLLNFNEHQWDLLRDLHKSVLTFTSDYHFFFEGDYTVVRVPDFLSKSVRGWIVSHDLNHEEHLYITDNIPITAKYQEYFERIFNDFSELAFIMNPEDFWDVLDRICHCWMNNNWIALHHNVNFENDGPGVCNKEALALHITATRRAATSGYYQRVAEQKVFTIDSVCCVCKKKYGEKETSVEPDESISHGYCEKCAKEAVSGI